MELSTKKFSYLKHSSTKSLNLLSVLFKKSKTQPNTYEWKYHGPLKEQKPKASHFTGKLLVLTDGATFSTSADVCAILHAQKRALFAGEEVGGGYYGNNSAINMDITLPNSRIMFGIPLVRYTNAVDYPDYYGHGVQPDFPIPYTYADYQSPEDLILTEALSLIKKM